MKFVAKQMPAAKSFSGKLSALLVASTVAATSSAFAEISNPDNKNAFSLKLRNYYQDRGPVNPSESYRQDDKTVKTQKKQQGWGQGIEVNFDSAYYGEDNAGIGMDFSLYGGIKLMGDKDRWGTTINKQGTPYYDSQSQKILADQGSYGKVGQAYVKGFVGTEGQKATAKIGWHKIERTLMKSYYRLTPTTFQGASLDAEVGDFDLYGSWYNKVSRHNHTRFENITGSGVDESGKHEKIDYAYTVGGSYSHESGLGSELAYAQSESYLKLYHANLNYTFNMGETTALYLEGQYYKGQSNGNKWKDNSQTYGGFDDNANLYNLNARLSLDMLAFKASYSQTDARKKGGLGHFDYHLGYDSGADYDDIGFWTNRQISKFDHDGEKVWQLGASYAFDRIGVPGLMVGYTYTTGSGIKTDNPKYADNYKESEHNIQLGYDFQQEQLKGLSFRILYANYKADKELSLVKNTSKQGYQDDGMTDLRVFVDYTLSVF